MPKKPIQIWIMAAGSTADQFYTLSNSYIQRLEKRFNIPLRLRIISWNHARSTIMQGLKSDDPPDVIQVGSTWLSTLAYMGLLAEVPASFPSYIPLADWIEDTCYDQGHKVAVPWFAETLMLLAQKEHLDRLSITSQDLHTTDGFLEVCNRMYQYHTTHRYTSYRLPFAFSIRPDTGILHIMISWLRSFGWDLGDVSHPFDDGDKKAMYEACSFLKHLLRVSHVEPDIASMHPNRITEEFYHQGNYSFTIGHWWKLVKDLYALEDPPPQQSTSLQVFPIPSAGVSGFSPWGGGSMLCVSTKSTYPDEAWTVVEAFTNDEYYDFRCRINGDIPAIQTSFQNRFAEIPDIARIYGEIRRAKPYPKAPLWMTYEKIYSECLSNLLWGFVYDQGSFDDLYDSILIHASERIRKINHLIWS